MTELRETTGLDVPLAQAERCMLQYFERFRNAEGRIEIPLCVNLSDFGLPGDLALQRTVNVSVAKRRDAQNLNDEIALRWDPGQGEPYPTFSGSITAWSETPGTTLIELRGAYEPPLGSAGKLFDGAVGNRIAKRTARDFLNALAEGARACYQP